MLSSSRPHAQLLQYTGGNQKAPPPQLIRNWLIRGTHHIHFRPPVRVHINSAVGIANLLQQGSERLPPASYIDCLRRTPRWSSKAFDTGLDFVTQQRHDEFLLWEVGRVARPLTQKGSRGPVGVRRRTLTLL